jgi:hypothetical protein
MHATLDKFAQHYSSLAASDVIAISAAFIAFLALIATFGQAWLSWRHNKLSVRPYVDYHCNTYSNIPITLGIANYGLGTAIIEDLIFSLDGVEHRFDNLTLQQSLLDLCKENNLKYAFMTISKNTPLLVGEKIDLITISNSNESINNHNIAVALISKLAFKLTYKSMYGEKHSLTRPAKHIVTPIKN